MLLHLDKINLNAYLYMAARRGYKFSEFVDMVEEDHQNVDMLNKDKAAIRVLYAEMLKKESVSKR